jgi:hypothetical protein
MAKKTKKRAKKLTEKPKESTKKEFNPLVLVYIFLGLTSFAIIISFYPDLEAEALSEALPFLIAISGVAAAYFNRHKVNQVISESSEKLPKITFKRIPSLLSSSEKNYLIPFLLIVLIYGILGIYKLGENDFRDDEFILINVTKGFAETGDFNRWDFVEDKPVYDLYKRAWPHTVIASYTQQIFGFNETTSRSVSVVFGLLCIISCYFIVRYLLRSRYLAVLITFLFAIHPYFLYFFRMFRMYALFVPMFVFLCFLIIHFFEKRYNHIVGSDKQNKILGWLYLGFLIYFFYLTFVIQILTVVIVPAVTVFFVYFAIARGGALRKVGYFVSGIAILAATLVIYKPDILSGISGIVDKVALFKVENLHYYRTTFLYPIDNYVTIAVLISGIPWLFTIRNDRYRNTMILLYLILFFGLFLVVYVFLYPGHFRYIIHLNAVAIILLSGNLILFTRLLPNKVFKYVLSGILILSSILIFYDKSDNLYSRNGLISRDDINYSTYSIPYQTIIDNFDYENDKLMGMMVRNYYLDDMKPNDYKVFPSNRKYTMDSLRNDLTANPNGWITWEFVKTYHFDPEVVNFIARNFRHVHGKNIDTFGVEVFRYDSLMVSCGLNGLPPAAKPKQETSKADTTDGRQVEQIINNFPVDFSKPFTLSFWYYAQSEVPGPPFSIGNYGTAISIESRENHSPGEIRFRYAPNGKGHLARTGLVNDSAWHHIVYYHSGGAAGSEYGIYVDGRQAAKEKSPVAKNATENLRFRRFNGYIVDFRFYKQVLNTEDVIKLYNGGVIDPRKQIAIIPDVHTFKNPR